MKTFYLLINLIILTTAANAQTKDYLAVETAVKNLKAAMLDGNKQQLELLTSDDLSYGHSSGKVESKDQFISSLVSGVSDFVTMDLSEQTIKITGTTAIVRHKLAGKTIDGGTPGTVNLGVMLVWQKQKNQWKLLGRQAFKL